MPETVTQIGVPALRVLMNWQNRLPGLPTAVRKGNRGRVTTLIRVHSLYLRDRARILNSRLLYR
jgi:hypothetical protein